MHRAFNNANRLHPLGEDTLMKSKALKAAALALSCALAVACLGLVACGGSSSGNSGSGSSNSGSASTGSYKLVESGKLTVGSDLDYKPMEYLDGDKPAGFGVDMTQEICNRLGLEMNFLSPQNFDSLITQVNGGTSMDVAVSSITINDEREELVDFSTPYYDSNLAIVTLADSDVASASDLSGKSVGAQSGSTGEEWAKENLGDSSYTPYTGPTDALTALRAGKIQAVVLDAPVASDYVKEDAGTYKLVDEIATGEQYGIAINKDNPELKKAIDSALADMQADGTLDKLKQKWLGTSN